MSEPQRIAFEHWMEENHTHEYSLKQQPDGSYLYPSTDLAWKAWQAANDDMLKWVVERWSAEIRSRPTKTVHYRTLDETWRQMIRHLGGDDTRLKDKPE